MILCPAACSGASSGNLQFCSKAQVREPVPILTTVSTVSEAWRAALLLVPQATESLLQSDLLILHPTTCHNCFLVLVATYLPGGGPMSSLAYQQVITLPNNSSLPFNTDWNQLSLFRSSQVKPVFSPRMKCPEGQELGACIFYPLNALNSCVIIRTVILSFCQSHHRITISPSFCTLCVHRLLT